MKLCHLPSSHARKQKNHASERKKNHLPPSSTQHPPTNPPMFLCKYHPVHTSHKTMGEEKGPPRRVWSVRHKIDCRDPKELNTRPKRNLEEHFLQHPIPPPNPCTLFHRTVKRIKAPTSYLYARLQTKPHCKF